MSPYLFVFFSFLSLFLSFLHCWPSHRRLVLSEKNIQRPNQSSLRIDFFNDCIFIFSQKQELGEEESEGGERERGMHEYSWGEGEGEDKDKEEEDEEEDEDEEEEEEEEEMEEEKEESEFFRMRRKEREDLENEREREKEKEDKEEERKRRKEIERKKEEEEFFRTKRERRERREKERREKQLPLPSLSLPSFPPFSLPTSPGSSIKKSTSPTSMPPILPSTTLRHSLTTGKFSFRYFIPLDQNFSFSLSPLTPTPSTTNPNNTDNQQLFIIEGGWGEGRVRVEWVVEGEKEKRKWLWGIAAGVCELRRERLYYKKGKVCEKNDNFGDNFTFFSPNLPLPKGFLQ